MWVAHSLQLYIVGGVCNQFNQIMCYCVFPIHILFLSVSILVIYVYLCFLYGQGVHTFEGLIFLDLFLTFEINLGIWSNIYEIFFESSTFDWNLYLAFISDIEIKVQLNWVAFNWGHDWRCSPEIYIFIYKENSIFLFGDSRHIRELMK